MSETDAIVARIAAALERLAPPPPATQSLAAGRFFAWSPSRGGLLAITEAKTVALDPLLEMEAQKAAFLTNLTQFAAGRPANNVLLWGVRGAGKSALARAAVSHVAQTHADLKLVAAAAADCARLEDLFAILPEDGARIVVFLDDLSFEGDEAGLRALKPVLEGGVTAKGANILIVAEAPPVWSRI
jgi:predicted AAA+ superfamily ATPase